MNTINTIDPEASEQLSSTDVNEAVRSTAMLADVTISTWTGNKSANEIIEEAKARAGATGNVGRASKNLLAGADGKLKDCKAAYAAVRTEHYSLTLPWVSDPHATKQSGPRLLTTMLFDKYMLAMSKAKRAAEAALEVFVADYPNAVQIAKGNLGSLADNEEYPTQEQVRAAFKVSFDFCPIPAGTQFRGLPDQTMARLSKQLHGRQKRMVATAQAAMWEQARERVAHAVERLSDPEATFKESTIEHVKELVELMPGWNVTGDERVTEITADISRMIDGVTSKQLRKNATTRMEASQKGQQVLEKLRSWGL